VRRLAATLRCDVLLQARNGFYWALSFLLTILVAVVLQLPPFDWAPVLPPLILGNLAVGTFFFMAGLVLLEKEEGTLHAQVVTPLRTREYLVSKVTTLTVLSVVEHLIIAWITVGSEVRPTPLVLGVVLASALYCLMGFLIVVRYDAINQMLFPAILWVTLFSLPILDYAGIWSTPAMLLHPFQAPLVVLRGAVSPLTPGEWAYGLLYSAAWIAFTFVWSRRAFRRFVVRSARIAP